MKIDEEFSMPCPKCGSTQFQYEEPLDDDKFVRCDSCLLEIKLADLKEHGVHEAREHVAEQLRAEMKKTFGKIFK